MAVMDENQTNYHGYTLKDSLLDHYIGSDLDDEILDFVQEINDIQKKQEPFEISIVAKIEDLVKSIWINGETKVGQGICNVEVKLYGSRKTGLCLDNSDLDIVICFLDEYNKTVPIKWRDDALSRLAKELQSAQCTWANNIKMINCKVPLIKFESESKEIDLSFACSYHSGLKIAEGILQYVEEYANLKPLVIILKKLKRSWDLPTPYDGGFGTYTLTMMVVSFLQMHKDSKNMNIGEALIKCVYFFALSFDFAKMALRPNKPYLPVNPSTVCVPSFGTDSFILFDPFKETNNLGHSVKDIQQQIKGPFQSFLNRLDKCLEYWHDGVGHDVLEHALNTNFKVCLPTVEKPRNPKSRLQRKQISHACSSPSSSLSSTKSSNQSTPTKPLLPPPPLLPTPSFTKQETGNWNKILKHPYYHTSIFTTPFVRDTPFTSHPRSHTSSRSHSRSQSWSPKCNLFSQSVPVSPQQFRRTPKKTIKNSFTIIMFLTICTGITSKIS